MASQHLTPDRYAAQPWRNGLGTSRTIASATDPAGRLCWTLSLTAITQDCPFSDYRGYDRVFTPVTGNGVTLAIDGGMPQRIDRVDHPFAFTGDARVECRLLGGSVEVINAMVARDWGLQTVTILRGEPLDYPITAPIVLIHALRGPVSISLHGRKFALAPGDTLRLDDETGGRAELALAPGAAAYAVAFQPLARPA